MLLLAQPKPAARAAAAAPRLFVTTARLSSVPAPAAAASPAPHRHPPPPRRRLVVARSESFTQPDLPMDRAPAGSSVDAPDEAAPEQRVLGLTFSDVYYYLNVTYWGLLLASVLTGNDLVSRLAHFEHYSTAMFAASVAFTTYHTGKLVRDVRAHLKSEARRDWRQVLRFAWNAVFWLAFVLWYAAPPVSAIAELTGTPGAIMSIYGATLALSAALQVGMWSFMGQATVPRKLQTSGVYALLQHPQAVGNMLFLIGFSMAGGALWASLAFLAAAAFYAASVVPREERTLRAAFGDEYERYAARTPRFAWALLLLLLLEAILLWRFQPWAAPMP